MFSDVIVNIISEASPDLEIGTTLFSEHTAEARCVVVTTTSEKPMDVNMSTEFRQAVLQIIIRGYTIVEGRLLGEKIVAALENTRGSYVVKDDASYLIYSTNFKTLPTLVSSGDKQDYSFNLGAYYFRSLS